MGIKEPKTAAGPEGQGGDAPDGAMWAVEVAIPPGLVAKAKAALWWVEEEQRAAENFLWPRAEAIRGTLIHEHGLLWALVRQAEGIAAQVGDGGTQ